MKALFYLECRAAVNGLKRIFRSPKSWIPAVLFLLAVSSIPLGSVTLAVALQSKEHHFPAVKPETLQTVWSGVFLILMFVCVQSLFRALQDGALVFQMSDVDFIFPSPVSRRTVLIHRLLQEYLLVGLVIGFFVTVGSMLIAMVGASLFIALPMIWASVTLLALSVSNLTHTLNLIFTFRMAELEWAGKGIKILLGVTSACFILLMIAAAYISLERTMPQLKDLTFVIRIVNNFAHHPVARVLLFPVTFTTDVIMLPVLKPSYHPVFSFLGLLGFFVSTFVLIVTRRENIYEPAIGISTRKARQMAAALKGEGMSAERELLVKRAAGKEQISPVPPFGVGAWALLWKNAVIAVRTVKPAQILPVLIIVAIYAFWRYHSPRDHGSSGMGFMYLLFFGTGMSQGMTRKELRQNWLKAMPIKGWKVIIAQVISQSLPISLLIIVMTFIFSANQPFTELLLTIVIAPAVAFAFASAGNVAAMFYPDLTDPVHNAMSGLAGAFLGSIPVAATMVIVLFSRSFGLPLPVTILLAASVDFAFAVLFIALAGRLYDKFDPTTE